MNLIVQEDIKEIVKNILYKTGNKMNLLLIIDIQFVKPRNDSYIICL